MTTGEAITAPSPDHGCEPARLSDPVAGGAALQPARCGTASTTAKGSTLTKPRVAVIGTGGTIASIGKGPLDLLDYGANETMLHVDEIIARFPEVYEVADILPVRFEAIPSPNIFFPEWKALVLQIETLAQEHRDLAGIVVTHGTASLEET